MLTVLEAIKLSTEYLEKKGIESPRTNAELLLADVLKCRRLDLYLRFDQPVSEPERLIYREYISRRSKYEPLQYILGYVEFFGLKIFVDKSVLIPRQETEILVETILEQNKNSRAISILDIGCGSGNIAISLAKHLPQSKIITLDLSEAAVDLAKRNVSFHSLDEQIKIMQGDIFNKKFTDELGSFDIIVSNPPYVDEDQYNTLQKEIIEHEPRIAITDSGDGYSFYEHITENTSDLLQAGGRLYYEVGIGQSDKVRSIMEKNSLIEINILKDYLDIERVIYGEKV